MNRQSKKIIISVFVLVIAGGYLLYALGRSSGVYCCSVDDFMASRQYNEAVSKKTTDNKIFRLAGRAENVQSGNDGGIFGFDLAGSEKKIQVKYSGMQAVVFEDGREIFAEGRISADGIFYADRILTRCDSKYKSKMNNRDK